MKHDLTVVFLVYSSLGQGRVSDVQDPSCFRLAGMYTSSNLGVQGLYPFDVASYVPRVQPALKVKIIFPIRTMKFLKIVVVT